VSGGSSIDERGTLLEVPAVLGTERVRPWRRSHRLVWAPTWRACARRRRTRSPSGLCSRLMIADLVLAFEAVGDQ
jgi:hypothetical protein